MLELSSFLLSLIMALKTVFSGIKSSEQKAIAKQIHQFHVQLQVIIDDADMMFNLIKTADKQIMEYGEYAFTRIIQDNFRSQLNRIEDLARKIQTPEMYIIFEKLDDRLKNRLESILAHPYLL